MMKKSAGGRGRGKKLGMPCGIVAFNYQDSTYQIDVARLKVYKRWIEVDRSKQIAVISAYRASGAPMASL